MGLAASQARLLSITQRISDNELRAQIINNQKMRLSSESSRVSENYINALNKTNLVFANYDENDNAQNVPLTFNNLTAFNQYNNQYGLTNTAGNILISEREADLYTQSNGDRDEFLRLHGIEYTTSYWDTIGEQLNYVEAYHEHPNGNDVYDDETTDGVYNFYNAEQLREMYEGSNNVASYENTIKTQTYNDFAAYVDKFEMEMAKLQEADRQSVSLQERFVTALIGSASYSWSNLGSGTSGDCGISATTLANNFDGLSTTDAQTVIDNINAKLTVEQFQTKNTDNFVTKTIGGATYYCEPTPYTGAYDTATPKYGLSEDETLSYETSTRKWWLEISDVDEAGNALITRYQVNVSGSPSTGFITVTSGTDAKRYIFDNIDPLNPKADVYTVLSDDEINKYAKDYIQDAIRIEINNILTTHSIKTTSQLARDNFNVDELNKLNGGSVTGLTDLVRDLATLIFGSNAGASSPYNYTDAYQLLAILNYLTEGNIKWSESTAEVNIGKDYKGNNVSFNWSHLALPEEVFNAYTLDTLMNIFGEPVYTYLYTDGNGNIIDDGSKRDASAEARWLTNLFEKIQSSGYQMLPNGLASSTEWLQFALENGIVVMEQVDAENNWKGITYNSCSDISEQTDSNAATIAEAEYNKAMRQIESKDEMFDLELKNIDTEHSSLQSEYESVKKAMSGNIERTFQMYS